MNHIHEHSVWQLSEVNSHFCPGALPNQLPVTCCLTFHSSFTREPQSVIVSNTFSFTFEEYIWHYDHVPKAGISLMFSPCLQPLSSSAWLHLETHLISSAPGQYHDACSADTQLPMHSRTCEIRYSWAAVSHGLISSERISFTSGYLVLCHLLH